MTKGQATTRTSTPLKKILVRAGAAIIIIAAGGIAVWTTTCPCEGVPGFVLMGPVEEKPVADWRFTNDVPLCQIQISTGWGPHAVNLNCMATPEGDLFLSCSVGTSKYWCQQVRQNEPARLRLNGTVYPVVINRVMEPAVLDKAWAARVKKLQVHGRVPHNPVPAPDAKRPDTWWSFQVRSRQGE